MRVVFPELYLIITSSLLLALVFIIPGFTAPLLLFFLMPLYVLKKKSISFRAGFLWGLVFYALYFHGIFILVIDYASGMLKIPLFFIFLLYCASTSGVWFVMTRVLLLFLNTINRRIQSLDKYSHVFCWTLSAFLYFLYIHYLFFLPLGAPLGNKLNNLLIIGANFLYLVIPHILYEMQLLLFLGLQATLFLSMHKLKHLLFFILLLLPYGYVWLFLVPPQQSQSLPEITIIACVPHTVERTLWQQATSFAHCLDHLQATHEKLIIITPEAAFLCALNYYQELYSSFNINKECALIIGTYRFDTMKYYNSLYLLQERRITQIYDKTTLMPLIEYIPFCYSSSTIIQNLFLNNALPITAGTNQRNPLTIHNHAFIPCICSEFFFDSFTLHDDASLIVILNDRWFNSSYIHDLFLLYAQYQAFVLSKSIIYVGYAQQYSINPKGQKTAIQCYRY